MITKRIVQLTPHSKEDNKVKENEWGIIYANTFG
jgi:hypothetical protein